MMNLFSLKNKVILITGALGGIGEAIVDLFVEYNATVILSDINQVKLKERQNDFQLQGKIVDIFPTDLSHDEDINNLIAYISTKYSQIDSLVFCSGVEGACKSHTNLDFDSVKKILDINLISAVKLANLLIPIMESNQPIGGSLTFISSIASIRGNKSLGIYGVSKAALNQLVRNIAVEFGPFNIRANTILPGLIETPLAKNLMANQQFMERRLLATPLRRVGQAYEVASIALLLASDAGAFITGQNIVVDGGTTISDGN